MTLEKSLVSETLLRIPDELCTDKSAWFSEGFAAHWPSISYVSNLLPVAPLV